VVGDKVDLERSVIRELTEETGLTLADVTPQPGWTATPFGQRIALMKIVQAREDADSLRARIVADLARQPAPELSDIHIVRSIDDLDARMPPYVRAYLAAALANRRRTA
jgi:8-oxo-dGTP pyrophosphatase MutT (NUDIX family)